MLLPKRQLEQAKNKLDFCTLVFFHVVTQSKVQCRITKTCLSNKMYGSMVIGNWFMHDITCIVFADRIWLIPIPHRLRSLPSAVYASNSPYTISWNVLLIGQRKNHYLQYRKDTRSSLQSPLSKNQTELNTFPQLFNHIFLLMSRKYLSVDIRQ